MAEGPPPAAGWDCGLSGRCGTFLGAGLALEPAAAVLLGAPLDVTGSFRPGTRFAPERVRAVSEALETYSPALDRDLEEVPFFDAGDVACPPGEVDAALAAIERAVRRVVDLRKLPVLVGGEHLVTLAGVRAARAAFPDLAVVQFDAHADLRDDYLERRLSHATVMRRVVELVGAHGVHQLGIRSGTREEFAFARRMTRLYPHQIVEPLAEVVRSLRGRPVYVTVDIDVLDPGFAPGAGTPEPGGRAPVELFQALHMLDDLRVVGVDVVELCPPADWADVTAVLVAKIVREALLAFGPGALATD